MDHLSNVSGLVPRGHIYGNISADGHATVVVGDVHINNRKPGEAAKCDLLRQGMHLDPHSLNRELDAS